ncbi:hypothetical protein N9157_03360 [Saprospiraceae bacterium]|jgi:hypothetical protein|nr:hypothetical protein [Saprospiraceae bacterium]MDG1434619.1 hypothetical protein [Saprospiraceae bacterium]
MRLFSFFITVVVFAACNNADDNYLKPRNLLEYGIPYTILAPDSVDIKKENLVVQDEVIIKSQKSDDYEVRVYFGEATKDVVATKGEHLNNLRSISVYSSVNVILDEPNGFVFETVIDSTLHNFGFRRIVIQGDREYIFQSGNGNYTKEQAEEMYQATIPQEMKQ